MQPIDIPTFREALAEHFVLMQRPAPDDKAAEVWFKHMRPFSVDRVKVALTVHARQGNFPAKPAELIKIIKGLDEDAPRVDGRQQCAFEHAGERCPLVGRYAVRESDANSGRLCGDHHELRKDQRASVAFLDLAVRRQIPFKPAANDLAVARHMLRAAGEPAVQASYGPRMVGFLRENPEPKAQKPIQTWPMAAASDRRHISRLVREPGED